MENNEHILSSVSIKYNPYDEKFRDFVDQIFKDSVDQFQKDNKCK